MSAWIVLLVNGGRIASRPLSERTLLDSLYPHHTVAAVNADGTEYWNLHHDCQRFKCGKVSRPSRSRGNKT